MSTPKITVCSGARLVTIVVLTGILAACQGQATAPAAPPATVAPATATPALPTSAPTVEATVSGGADPTLVAQAEISPTVEVTATQPVSETVVVVEAPEIKVDVEKIWSEIQRALAEIGKVAEIKQVNTYTFQVPMKDEAGNTTIVAVPITSIEITTTDGNLQATTFAEASSGANKYSEEERATMEWLVSRGLRKLAAAGYDANVRLSGRKPLVETRVAVSIALEEYGDTFAKALNGTGASELGKMSPVAGTGAHAASGSGYLIVDGGVSSQYSRDSLIDDISRSAEEEIGTSKPLSVSNPLVIDMMVANLVNQSSIEGTLKNINELLYDGEEVLKPEQFQLPND